MNQVIRNGRLLDPARGVDQVGDLWISAGAITAMGEPPGSFEPDSEFDASSLWVMPGLVDLCARLGASPDQETRAAARGGFTTVCCPPDTGPVLDSVAVLKHLLAQTADSSSARILTIGALTSGLQGTGLADHDTLLRNGCVGLGNGSNGIGDSHVMRSAMQTARSLGATVFIRPEDPSLAGGCAHDGPIATRLGLQGIPASAEAAGMARDLALIEETGVRAHFCRLSSAVGVQLLEQARSRGLPVTADVAMHQLFLTEHDISGFDANCHTRPPLRATSDREALIDAVRHGVIDAICSDHTPLGVDAKLAPFADTEPGISAAETVLGLGMRLVEDDRLDLSTLLAALVDNPTRVLGRTPAGLSAGAPADLVIYDPAAVWRCDPDEFISDGHNSPFSGWEFQGQVVATFCDGRQTPATD
ncbi:MAG: dihydroorotase [Xanthomonadales bacterium]|nr:dihydroorotase [Xanthomonadales bacterium]